MAELEKLTLKALLENSVEKYADNLAVSKVDGQPITYYEFGEEVRTLTAFLRNEGIGAGDRVAILSENKPNWGIAYFAITSMGALAVPILPDFHPNEIQHIIRHAECKAIFVSEQLFEKIEEAQFETVKSVILLDTLQLLPPDSRKEMIRDVLKKGGREFTKLKSAAMKIAGKQPTDVHENDLACIIYTSGTTGNSKGVMLTHKNLVSDAIAGSQIHEVTENDRFLSILPLSHTYECTIGFLIPIMKGASIYYFEKTPTPRLLLEALAKIKPTTMLSVPLVIEKIYKTRILPQLTHNALLKKLYQIGIIRKRLHRLAGKKLLKSFGGNLKFFGIGGALLAREVEVFLRDAHFPYAIGYGLTETSPLIAGCDVHETKLLSTGSVVKGVELEIRNPSPVTGEGEIWVRGPVVMKGYYKDPERTAEVLSEDGWFRTGDLGVLDEDGFLYIKGRFKNMIVGPSGENIYPEEIEAVINEYDYVMESLVYLQEGRLTARVHLNYEELDREFATGKLDESAVRQRIKEILDNLRTQVNQRLSAYSRLQRIIEQTEPFEKTPTQKTKRYLYVE